MIYVSIITIPQRLKNLNETVESLLNQTLKPNKIFINIPYKYDRFSEIIKDNQIPKFNSDAVEVTRCEDCGPGTKLLGSLSKFEKNSLWPGASMMIYCRPAHWKKVRAVSIVIPCSCSSKKASNKKASRNTTFL